MRTLLQSILGAIQFVAARAANAGQPASQLPSSHDLLKAKWISEYMEAQDSVLDVGAGNGARLAALSLFLPDLHIRGLEIGDARPRKDQLPFGTSPDLISFDGKLLPESDNAFDVVMICYVLHHLSAAQCQQTLTEAIRVARKRVILLEDSVAEFGIAYRLRNWAHIAETNVEYAARSTDFRKVDASGFKTHGEWLEYLAGFPGVADVACVPLTPISKYAHHTMFVVDLGSAGGPD